jgi:hypothetical protein
MTGFVSDYDRKFHEDSVEIHRKRMIEDMVYASTWLSSAMAVSNSRITAKQYQLALESIRPLKDMLDEQNKQVLTATAAHFNLSTSAIELGAWDCPASPTGYCVYNIHQGQGRDSCLICHLPAERK